MDTVLTTAVKMMNKCAPSLIDNDITPTHLHSLLIKDVEETVTFDILVLNNSKKKLGNAGHLFIYLK